jgi:hypothetical protein
MSEPQRDPRTDGREETREAELPPLPDEEVQAGVEHDREVANPGGGTVDPDRAGR